MDCTESQTAHSHHKGRPAFCPPSTPSSHLLSPSTSDFTKMLNERRHSPSPSPSRSLGSRISAIGARLTRRLSNADSQQYGSEEQDSISPILARTRTDTTERSISRGREGFTSTGRGGIGNIRPTSQSRDARPETGPDDFSPIRGRELADPSQVFSTGRGGAGNLRSPSRDPAVVDFAEQELIKQYSASTENALYSTGRGGIGNINRSRSREPSSTRSGSRDTTQVYSSGRGGAGNIYLGDGIRPETIDENERRQFSTNNEGYRSTGRGGAANITLVPEPAIEHRSQSATAFTSTGRGGSGNIIAHRSPSRAPP